MSNKGLAMAYPNYPQDRVSLNVGWWYVWSVNTDYMADPAYVPMMRTGKETNLPKDYTGFCLLFNEPENPEPNGMDASVFEMVARYEVAMYHHPNTKFVVGGVAAWNYSILSKFMARCIKLDVAVPDFWHVHAYVYREYSVGISKIKNYLAKFKNLGGETWVTEYGVPTLNRYTLPDFQSVTTYIKSQPWITRYAAYTNRQAGTEDWEIGKGCNLCDWNTGTLTPVGEYYAAQ